MDEINELLDEHGVSKENLEAALELARLTGEETGLCCAELGQFAWACYLKLEGEGNESFG